MYLEDLVSFCFSLYLYTDGQVHVILKRRAAASAIIDSGTFLPGRSWKLKVRYNYSASTSTSGHLPNY